MADLHDLYATIKAGKGRAARQHTFKGLLDATQIHFAATEALMNLYRCPDYAADGDVGAKRGAPGQDRDQQFHIGTIDSPIQIANFRKAWFNAHIMGIDQKCPPALKAPDEA